MDNIDGNMLSKNNWNVDRNFLRKYHHDMKEPLRNISSFLQIIKLDLANNDKQPMNNSDLLYYINNAINCLSILNDFNNSILNYSENNTEMKSQNLNTIITKIICLLSYQMIIRKCHVDVQDDLPPINCSAIDLFRIFKNLIENSIKYAVCNELLIKISCNGKINDNIVLLFEDNGKLLNRDTKVEIKRTLNEEISDSVIASFGLPIVRELIKKNNGSITLLEEKIGCAYEIKLPAL
ncbi:MAG: HAMP domain-containing histidine kinase [Alphaproteobacteria bacterium]|nr:HAMP domain-containing histidine kinase [Alphaproteobacteria bacterium]